MANPLEKQQPFVRGNLTRLRVLLGGKKTGAWKLIATPKGLASWFPTSVKGRIAAGERVEFGWTTGSEKHRVLGVKNGESWQMDWREKGRVRYSIKGENPTIFTVEARYPKKGEGRREKVAAARSRWLGFLHS